MKWAFKSVNEAPIDSLAAELQANPLLRIKEHAHAATLARLLVMRGIADSDSANRFLNPALAHLHSPYSMTGMKTAITRLEAAVERKQGILIYGDYDVDGTTAIIILKTAIELCGGSADFHVPHRIHEGYGMKDDIIERAAAKGVRLIISVDTGIRALTAAENAGRLGVDLIVTDHHLPGHDGLPAALAVLNPNQPGCGYPCKALCGAGVAFKLAQALMERKLDRHDQSRLLTSFLKVVAIATIADAVPLVDENRVFAKLGLEALRSPVNIGLKALLEVAQLGARPLTSGEVAFRIAPRLNAAGRMDVARDVVELFSVKDPLRARQLAAHLDKLNGDRQEEERRILAEIDSRFEQEPALADCYCLVIDGEAWHRGVIGITATRVVERYGRPTLVISRDGDEAHGSGRSIRAFHLLDALESCRTLFTRYGGHSHAVGFSLPAALVPDLRRHLESYARTHLAPADFEPAIDLDAELPLEQITPQWFEVLSRLEPFGQGNPEPIFSAEAVRLMAPARVLKDKHAKLKLAPSLPAVAPASRRLSWEPPAPTGDDTSPSPEKILTTARCHPDAAAFRGRELRSAGEKAEARSANSSWRRAVTFEALAWRMADRLEQEKLLAGDTLDIAYTIGHNDHPEFGGLELTLCDFKTRDQSRTAEHLEKSNQSRAAKIDSATMP
jgi:single-stranded-DNA-specific exonuclease